MLYLKGLKITIQLQIKLDAKMVIDMLLNDILNNCLLNPLIMQCRNLIKRIPHNCIKHVYRETNSYANCLAKKGQMVQSPLILFSSPSLNVIPLLKNDIFLVMFRHFVPHNTFCINWFVCFS